MYVPVMPVSAYTALAFVFGFIQIDWWWWWWRACFSIYDKLFMFKVRISRVIAWWMDAGSKPCSEGSFGWNGHCAAQIQSPTPTQGTISSVYISV